MHAIRCYGGRQGALSLPLFFEFLILINIALRESKRS